MALVGRAAVLAGLLSCLLFALISQGSVTAAASPCPSSLQAEIDAAPAGSTIDLPDGCVYRQRVAITKPITLKGGPGVEIRGSDVWTAWEEVADGWRSHETLPPFPQEDVSCELNTMRCAWPEQVFVNGVAQTQVASGSTLNTGEFYVDGSRRVVMGTDPTDKFVEVTVRRHWITGTAAADNVTIEDFTMKHAANEWRSGGIINRPPTTVNADGSYSWSRFKGNGSNWTLKNNALTDAHGAILSVKGATGHQVLNNEIARGGQLGIHNSGNNSLIQGNDIHHNNTEDFCFVSRSCTVVSSDGAVFEDSGIKEAGGIKLAGGLRSITVDSNEVNHNQGNGIWYDVGTYDGVVSNNRVHHNTRRGIHFEISDRGKIFNNIIYENGWTTPDFVNGAGIGISNSRDVEVYNNTLAWNADGIAVVGLNREGTENDAVTGVYVHDNTVYQEHTNVAGDSKTVALGWIQGWTTQMFESDANNQGSNNRYYYPAPKGAARYEWGQTRYSSLAEFNATRGEQRGRSLTWSRIKAIAAKKGIPVRPELR